MSRSPVTIVVSRPRRSASTVMRPDDVVGLEAGQLVDRDAERLDDLADLRELVAQVVRHPLAGRLVLGVLLVAERRAREVEGDRDVVRLEVLDAAQDDAAEAEHRVDELALRRRQGREGEVAAVDEPVAVEQHQAFHRQASGSVRTGRGRGSPVYPWPASRRWRPAARQPPRRVRCGGAELRPQGEERDPGEQRRDRHDEDERGAAVRRRRRRQRLECAGAGLGAESSGWADALVVAAGRGVQVALRGRCRRPDPVRTTPPAAAARTWLRRAGVGAGRGGRCGRARRRRRDAGAAAALAAALAWPSAVLPTSSRLGAEAAALAAADPAAPPNDGRTDGAVPTSTPTRPSVVRPTASGRREPVPRGPDAASQPRRPPRRSRRASAAVSW